MKLVLLIVISIVLTGCGTYGEPLLLAQMYDRQDPCQSRNWKENGGHMDLSNVPRGAQSGYPDFCGAGGSRTRTYIYDANGRVLGYTR